MTSHSDYRTANVATTKEWEREMVLEKAAYHMDLLGYAADAKILRVFRKGEAALLLHMMDHLDEALAKAGLPDDEAEHDEGEEGEAFND